MKELLYFILKQIRLHRRFLLVFLALLPMVLLVVSNPLYQNLKSNNDRHVGITSGQRAMRQIIRNVPSVLETSSESKNNTKEAVDTDIGTSKRTMSGAINTSNDRAEIISLSNNFTRYTSNLDFKSMAFSKPITINNTNVMLGMKTTTPNTLKKNITVELFLGVDKTKLEINKTTEDGSVAVTQNPIQSKSHILGAHNGKQPDQTKTTPLSISRRRMDIVSESFCSMYSNSFKYLIWPDSPSDFSDWTFKRKRKCPNFKIPDNINDTKRVKFTLNCDRNNTKLIPTFTHRSDDIQIVALDDPCLAAFTNSCCNDTRGIPNIVHYVWYFKNEMRFAMFTSILSVIRFVRPCLILFHGEYLPYGKYWDYIVRIYPNILHVYTIRPLYIFGKKISHHEHSGDIMRMEALMQLGGIYLDTDVIVFRDLEPLREYNITLCYQATGYLLNAFIMTKRNATFLNLWMDGYKKDYKNDSYVYNSMFYNKDLANNRSDLIHIEQGTICSPLVLIGRPVNSSMVYDWTKLFGYHLYARTIHFPLNEVWIKHFNSTVGAMIRHVIYGNKELCEGPVHTFS